MIDLIFDTDIGLSKCIMAFSFTTTYLILFCVFKSISSILSVID